MRLDLDVEINGENQVDEFHDLRLERAAAVIRKLLDFGASGITLCGHCGRPQGKRDPNLSLLPVKARLEILLSEQGVKELIGFVEDLTIEPASQSKLTLLENLRFYPGEEAGDSEFAHKLARWGEIYVNDAFGVCHRSDASVLAIAAVIKQSFAGPNLIEEVLEQEKFLANIVPPFAVILGGVKISTKLPLIKNLLAKADAVLLGGGLANTVLASRGVEVGQSVIEPDMLSAAKDLNEKIVLPQDFTVLKENGATAVLEPAAISKTDFILDVGPKTSADYAKIISSAKSALWNGPMGKFEDQRGKSGTEAIAQALASSQAKTLVGGGDTVVAVEQLGLAEKFGFVSVGGGAMLTFLSGESMPALEVLKISN